MLLFGHLQRKSSNIYIDVKFRYINTLQATHECNEYYHMKKLTKGGSGLEKVTCIYIGGL